MARRPRLRAADDARSLHFGRDDRNVRFTFIQCGGSNEPVNICRERSDFVQHGCPLSS
jgi:hypothetical protein